MANKIIITPEAETDIVEAFDWYQYHRAGLGEEFLNCVEACIETILRTPKMYSMVYEKYRRGLVRRFPYAIFYEYDNDMVIIYGVFHTSRDSSKWRKRLP